MNLHVLFFGILRLFQLRTYINFSCPGKKSHIELTKSADDDSGTMGAHKQEENQR